MDRHSYYMGGYIKFNIGGGPYIIHLLSFQENNISIVYKTCHKSKVRSYEQPCRTLNE